MCALKHTQRCAHKKCACQNEIELWKAQTPVTSDTGSFCLSLSYSVMDLFVVFHFVGCSGGPGEGSFCGPGDLVVSATHTKITSILLRSAKHGLGRCECEADRGLMLACALAGPTVEQQGEMARSGGRMLATLEPEQVRRSLTVWEVSEQSVLYILV